MPKFKMHPMIVLLLVACLPSAVCAVQDTIPTLDFPETAATRSEFINTKKLKFLNRQLAFYERFSKDTKAIKELAIPFLQTSIERFAGVPKHMAQYSEKWDEIEAQGAKLIEADCSDPIVLTYYADALRESNKYSESKKVASQAINLFENSDYPSGLKFLAHYQKHRTHGFALYRGLGPVEETLRGLFETSPMWFDFADDYQDGSQVAWDLYLDAVLFDSDHKFLEEPAKQAIDTYADAEAPDFWVLSMMRAQYYRGVAWAARGRGFASQVESEGWKKFEKNMKLAAVHARNAYKANPERPDAPAYLIHIAKTGHDDDTIFQWFERAIEAEIDYPPAYRELLSALRPRWSGSHAAMLDFGRQCAATEKYETDVPAFFLDALHKIVKDRSSETWSKLIEDDSLFDEVEKAVDGLVKDPSRHASQNNGDRKFSKPQAEYLTQLLGIADSSNRFEKAVKLWQRLDDEVSNQWLQTFSLNAAYNPGRAQAGIELGAATMGEIDSQLSQLGQNLESATSGLKSIEGWLGQVENESAKFYFRLWEKLARQAVKYHSEQWVDIEFSPGVPAWKDLLGKWTFESPDSVLADNREAVGRTRQKMYYRLQFPGAKEIEFTMAKGEIGSTAYGGLVLGEYSYRDPGRLFYADVTRKKFGVSVAGKSSKSRSVDSLSPILVRMWTGGQYEVFSGGNRVRKLTEDNEFKDEGLIGLSTLHKIARTGQLRFQNIRVRKVTALPKPSPGEDEKLVEYYSQQIDSEPDELNNYAQRGLSLRRLGRYEEAVQDLQRCNRGLKSFRTNYALGHSLCRTGKLEQGIELLSKTVHEIRMRLDDRHGIYQRIEHISLLSISEALLAQELVLNHPDQENIGSVSRQLVLDSETHRKLLDLFSDGKLEVENQLRELAKRLADYEYALAKALALHEIGETRKARDAVANLQNSKLTEYQRRRLKEVAGVIGTE